MIWDSYTLLGTRALKFAFTNKFKLHNQKVKSFHDVICRSTLSPTRLQPVREYCTGVPGG